MKTAVILIPMLALSATVEQVDIVCRQYCSVLEVKDGLVQLTDESSRGPRRITIGRYVPEDQKLVSRTEAPTCDLRSPNGWRIVVSAVLDHQELGVKQRLRFFDSRGVLRLQYDVLAVLEQQRIGRLFGGADDVLAVTSNEEHAYNARTDIWFLPEQGDPKQVLSVVGVFQTFSNEGDPPGLVLARQTYDGVDSTTKGFVREEYAWDAIAKVLRLRSK
jgi:hypothetical protein